MGYVATSAPWPVTDGFRTDTGSKPGCIRPHILTILILQERSWIWRFLTDTGANTMEKSAR